LRTVDPKSVYLTVVWDPIWPTCIRAARPKSNNAAVAFERSSLALDPRKRSIKIVDDNVIPQAVADWPEDRFARLQQGKDDRLLGDIAFGGCVHRAAFHV